MREARGVLLRTLLGGAENIPFEPDPGNAGAGNGLPGTHKSVSVREGFTPGSHAKVGANEGCSEWEDG